MKHTPTDPGGFARGERNEGTRDTLVQLANQIEVHQLTSMNSHERPIQQPLFKRRQALFEQVLATLVAKRRILGFGVESGNITGIENKNRIPFADLDTRHWCPLLLLHYALYEERQPLGVRLRIASPSADARQCLFEARFCYGLEQIVDRCKFKGLNRKLIVRISSA